MLYQDGATAASKRPTQATLLQVFSGISRLMHPMMPFLSEEIWQHLPHTEGSVMVQPYPKPEDYVDDIAAATEAGFVAEVVKAIRRMRSEYSVAPKDRVTFTCSANATQQGYLQKHAAVVATLAKADATALAGASSQAGGHRCRRRGRSLCAVGGAHRLRGGKSTVAKRDCQARQRERPPRQTARQCLFRRTRSRRSGGGKARAFGCTQSQKAALNAALQRLSA